MIQIVTNKGVRDLNMEENQREPDQMHGLLRDIERLGKEDGNLLFVICRRETTKITLFDVMLNTLQVSLLLLSPGKGVMYPANVLNRRASALCVNA